MILLRYNLLFFALLPTFLLGQLPDREDILQGYYVGHKAFEAIQILDNQLIEDYYKDTSNLSFLVQGIESGRFQEDSLKISKDIMYNRETGHFEFLVFGGNYLPSDDEWGLFDYHFVVQIEIDLKLKERKDQILKTSIIKGTDMDDLKKWWQSYMDSYKDPKFAKKEIADKYGLIPPPPPPPETEDWF